jgi:hypothetical protein
MEQDVDPELQVLRVLFDQPMDREGWSLVGGGPSFPKLVGKPWWDDDRLFLSRWMLQPGHDYSLSINSQTFTNFRNLNGEPVAPYPVRFRTGGNPLPVAEEPGNLQAVFESDLQAFLNEVDRVYPFFDLKTIREDWQRTKDDLHERLPQCETSTDFLGLVVDAIRCLRDAHMRIGQTQVPIPRPQQEFYPGVSFIPASNNRVIVLTVVPALSDQLPQGTVVTGIDGQPARVALEQASMAAWGSENPFFVSSPQRARLFTWRIPLRGLRGTRHTLRYLTDNTEHELELECNLPVRGWPHTYNLPSSLIRPSRTVGYTILEQRIGYIYLAKVDRTTEPGIRQALETHPGASAWIVDLRGNGGGGYDQSLISLIKSFPRPVAVLIDAGCISAGETLARDFRRYADATLMGSKTAGSSTSKRDWTFPSGIASIKFSIRSRWRADGLPIEFNGIEPDHVIEAVPEEVASGLNSTVVRAVEYLQRAVNNR